MWAGRSSTLSSPLHGLQGCEGQAAAGQEEGGAGAGGAGGLPGLPLTGAVVQSNFMFILTTADTTCIE